MQTQCMHAGTSSCVCGTCAGARGGSGSEADDAAQPAQGAARQAELEAVRALALNLQARLESLSQPPPPTFNAYTLQTAPPPPPPPHLLPSQTQLQQQQQQQQPLLLEALWGSARPTSAPTQRHAHAGCTGNGSGHFGQELLLPRPREAWGLAAEGPDTDAPMEEADGCVHTFPPRADLQQQQQQQQQHLAVAGAPHGAIPPTPLRPGTAAAAPAGRGSPPREHAKKLRLSPDDAAPQAQVGLCGVELPV